MAGTRIVVDGLWRCLCPSVDKAALLRAVNGNHQDRPRLFSGRPLKQGRPRAVRAPPRTAPPTCQQRGVHSDANFRVGRLGLVSPMGPDGQRVRPARPAKAPLDDERALTHLLRARAPCWQQLHDASTPVIYEAVRQLQKSMCGMDKMEAMVRFLLEERGEAPSAMLCEALLWGNCSTAGSAKAVADALQLIRRGTIEATAGVFHAALAVLAVHPDYVARAAVLAEMQTRWLDVTADGRHSVLLGLLRDGQYERALAQLEALGDEAAARGGDGAPPPWLLDIFAYVFLQEGFLDEALALVDQRVLRESDLVTPNLWYAVLDACCRLGHYPGLVYVWNRAVRSASGRSILTPSDAMALDVLNLAAQHGDANLAAAVMQMLAARGTKLGLPHFEAMLDCYCRAGNAAKALQVLCIMDGAGIVPDASTTRSVFLLLVEGRVDALPAAVDALLGLKKQYGRVPRAAFNVVVEAMLEHRGHAVPVADDDVETIHPGVAMALDLYRHVRQLCPDGPDRATFRLLFASCTRPQHLSFLLREMRAFGIRPDIAFVNKAVHENAVHGSLDAAVGHVFDLMDASEIENADADHEDGVDEDGSEALRRRQWIDRRTAAALVRRCLDEHDARLDAIARASRRRGRPMDTVIAAAQEGAPMVTKDVVYGVPRLIDLGSTADAHLEGSGTPR